MAPRFLAVIDRDSRATGEDYVDLLLFCVGMRANLGTFDVVLRGHAATCALAEPGLDTVADEKRQLDSQRYLRTLLRSGVRVWADGSDLTGLGHQGKPVLTGIALADTSGMAATWFEYDRVWFL